MTTCTNPKSFNQAPYATSTRTHLSYSGYGRGDAHSALPSPYQRSRVAAQPCLRAPGLMHSQHVNAAYVHHQAAHTAPPILPPPSCSPISSHTPPDPSGMTLGQRRAALRLESRTSAAPQPPQPTALPLSQQRATLQASQPFHSAQPLFAHSLDKRGAGMQDSSQAYPSIQSSQRNPMISSGRIPLRPPNAVGAVRCDPAGHDPSQRSTSFSICGPYRPDNAPAEAFTAVPAAGMKRRAEFLLATDARASSGWHASSPDRPPHPLASRLTEACEAPASAEAVQEERYPWIVNRRDARGHLPTDAAFDCTTLYIPNSVSPTVMPSACLTVVCHCVVARASDSEHLHGIYPCQSSWGGFARLAGAVSATGLQAPILGAQAHAHGHGAVRAGGQLLQSVGENSPPPFFPPPRDVPRGNLNVT